MQFKRITSVFILTWVYIYIYILLEFTFSHRALLRNNMYVDLGYLIFSFRTLMFWLAILYHVGHCYVMTTRQPYFNRDYKITFCKCELWLPKSRVSTTVCKTWKGSRHRIRAITNGTKNSRFDKEDYFHVLVFYTGYFIK